VVKPKISAKLIYTFTNTVFNTFLLIVSQPYELAKITIILSGKSVVNFATS